MIGVSKTIELLGGRFKGRADWGYNRYDYTLPTGDVVTVDAHEVWISGNQSGQGSDSLWKAFGAKVDEWKRTQEQNRINAEQKSWEKWKTAFQHLSDWLTVQGWGDCRVHMGTATEYYPYPTLTIKVDGSWEVSVEFGKNAEVLHGSSRAGTAFTGLPSFRKMAKKRYDYEEKHS